MITAKKKIPIILASSSPRRRDLLRQIDVDFTVDPAEVNERILPGEVPEDYAIRVSLDKARTAAGKAGKGIIIAADTIVVFKKVILGKPADSRDAERMLEMLSGKMHRVITGLSVMNAASGVVSCKTSTTRVWFRNLDEDEVKKYVLSGEPLDKAGAYGIQGKGALLVSRIEGCYNNVVGLPLALLDEMLRKFGIKLL
ncbi:MAG TPA: Maf family protein [Nitrospirota bacterium]|nr:Maf family protein [Nitrospirota bacterium]